MTPVHSSEQLLAAMLLAYGMGLAMASPLSWRAWRSGLRAGAEGALRRLVLRYRVGAGPEALGEIVEATVEGREPRC